MTRYFASLILLALMGATGADASSLCDQQRGDDQKKTQTEAKQEAKPKTDAKPEDPPRFKWWLQPDNRKELRLTDAQSKKINEVWEATAPKQRERWHELERLEQALEKSLKDSTADVAAIAQQVEKVEKLRSEANATRTVMIYRMHLVLTPEQREKVEAMYKRMEEDRKRREDERKRQGKQEDNR